MKEEKMKLSKEAKFILTLTATWGIIFFFYPIFLTLGIFLLFVITFYSMISVELIFFRIDCRIKELFNELKP